MTTASWAGPALDEEQRAVADLADRLVADLGEPRDGRAGGDEETVDAAAGRDALVRAGLWGLAMPEHVGGGGASPVTLLVLLERLGRARPALALSCAATTTAGTLLAAAPEGAPHVAALVGGRPAAVLPIGEPPAAPAVRDDGGPVLDGPAGRADAGSADPLLVLVGAGLRDGVAVLPPGADGVMVSQPLDRTGLAGASTRWVTLAGARPLALSLPDAATSVPAAMRLLRLGGAAVACGIAAEALDSAGRYVATREQFGAPLAALPTMQRGLFDAALPVGAALHQAFGVAGAPPGPRSGADAAAALRAATTAAVDATVAAVQALGGYGYLTEYPVERRMRDAVSLRAACGSWAVARAGAAARLVGA